MQCLWCATDELGELWTIECQWVEEVYIQILDFEEHQFGPRGALNFPTPVNRNQLRTGR